MACRCNTGLSNTGQGCSPIQAVSNKLIIVPFYGDDNSINQLEIVNTPATYDEAFFSALINNADRAERWFPLPEMKNIVDERGDNISEGFDDGSEIFVQEGARSFMGLIIKPTPGYKGKLDAMRCVAIGAYVIDKEGNLIGEQIEDGYLAPIRIDENSFSAKLIKPTDTTVQKIEVKFNWHTNAKDERLTMLTVDEMEYDVSQLLGLKDVSPEYSNIDNTTFDVLLKTEYGTLANPVVVEGLLAADFALYNVTDSLAVTITSATEIDDGTYRIVFATQTNADELRLTPTKAGYDFQNVVDDLITMPLT